MLGEEHLSTNHLIVSFNHSYSLEYSPPRQRFPSVWHLLQLTPPLSQPLPTHFLKPCALLGTLTKVTHEFFGRNFTPTVYTLLKVAPNQNKGPFSIYQRVLLQTKQSLQRSIRLVRFITVTSNSHFQKSTNQDITPLGTMTLRKNT